MNRTRRAGDVAAAVGMMVLACALVAGTTLFAKMLGRAVDGAPIHPLQVSAGRYFFALLALVPIILWRRPRFAGTAWGNHLARVAAGWSGVTCLFAASALMRLADATAISFLNPIVAMVLAIPLLGESVGRWRWGAATIALAGALVLTNPGSDAFQPAALIALAAALFIGLEVVLVKKLTNREPTLRILVVGNFLGTVLSVAAAGFVWRQPSASQWALLAAIGIAMVAAQALFLEALRRGDASFIVPLFYTTLVFAGLYDFAVFGEKPGIYSLAGSVLIVTGAVAIAWRERLRG
ncbi:DMT family transporter [Nitratireductor alexandrii]|uniref:DMT family transporter n=1 Tax=Nitratireductor alexandrii TaxID=2448161 RepID=UPI001EE8951E|nr:DMT family transporter [Nitratireductor alexandrii]